MTWTLIAFGVVGLVFAVTIVLETRQSRKERQWEEWVRRRDFYRPTERTMIHGRWHTRQQAEDHEDS